MTFTALGEVLGEPDPSYALERIITITYADHGLQAVVTSANASVTTDDTRACRALEGARVAES